MQGFSHGPAAPDPRTGWPALKITPSGIACGLGAIPTWLPSSDRCVVSVTNASSGDDGVSPAVTRLLIVCFPAFFFCSDPISSTLIFPAQELHNPHASGADRLLAKTRFCNVAKFSAPILLWPCSRRCQSNNSFIPLGYYCWVICASTMG